MLIREPELAYNTENKRKPRGGRQYCETCSGGPDVFADPNSIESLRQLRKRSAEDEDEGEDLMTEENDAVHSKRHWVNLFNGFADMTASISPDLALFLYCMLN